MPGEAKEAGEGSNPAGVAAQKVGVQAEAEVEQMVTSLAETPQHEEEGLAMAGVSPSTAVVRPDRTEGTATGTARFGAGEEEEVESSDMAEEGVCAGGHRGGSKAELVTLQGPPPDD